VNDRKVPVGCGQCAAVAALNPLSSWQLVKKKSISQHSLTLYLPFWINCINFIHLFTSYYVTIN